MIWIIGEYGDKIDNSVELIMSFAEDFVEEAALVQLSILTAAVKVYLKLDGEGEDMIVEILKLATEKCYDPDLRNRGYIYWRLLSTDPEQAKQVILAEKPPISEDSSSFDPPLLEKLV